MNLIITRLTSKSLCLGWSCETGPSRNITTVVVFKKKKKKKEERGKKTQIQTITLSLAFGGQTQGMISYDCLCVYFTPRPCLPSVFLLSVFSFHHLLPFVCVLCLPDGAAMRAGVQTGDRIIKVGVYLLPSVTLSSPESIRSLQAATLWPSSVFFSSCFSCT